MAFQDSTEAKESSLGEIRTMSPVCWGLLDCVSFVDSLGALVLSLYHIFCVLCQWRCGIVPPLSAALAIADFILNHCPTKHRWRRFRDIPEMRVRATDQETWLVGGNIHYRMPMMQNRLSSQCQNLSFSSLHSLQNRCRMAYCDNENQADKSRAEALWKVVQSLRCFLVRWHS
jgi:hypothetical protein